MIVINTAKQTIYWQEFCFPPNTPVDMGKLLWEEKLANELMSRIPALKPCSDVDEKRKKMLDNLKKARDARRAKRKIDKRGKK